VHSNIPERTTNPDTQKTATSFPASIRWDTQRRTDGLLCLHEDFKAVAEFMQRIRQRQDFSPYGESKLMSSEPQPHLLNFRSTKGSGPYLEYGLRFVETRTALDLITAKCSRQPEARYANESGCPDSSNMLGHATWFFG
jgi:hypothetical protein